MLAHFMAACEEPGVLLFPVHRKVCDFTNVRDDQTLLTSDEAAQLLGVSGQTVRRYITAGRLEVVRKVGKARLVHRSDVEALERPRRGRPRKGAA